jgi:lycopene cyclase domain-containing protein
MTYAFLCLAVLVVIAAVTVPTLRRLPGRPLLWAGLTLLALTLVFDNIMVSVGLVAYDDDLILGIRLPVAPLEDLSYTLAAIMLVPAVWTWLGRRADPDADAHRERADEAGER